jgi:hypothetical protein
MEVPRPLNRSGGTGPTSREGIPRAGSASGRDHDGNSALVARGLDRVLPRDNIQQLNEPESVLAGFDLGHGLTP